MNESTACQCQLVVVGCLIEDKKSKSNKGHNSGEKKYFEVSPLIKWIALWTVNTYSKFQINIFRNITYHKMSKFLHHDDNNVKVIAIPRAFSKNSQGDKIVFFFKVYREYLHSAVVYQKYLTRLRELIIFEPWRENYHFSQPS